MSGKASLPQATDDQLRELTYLADHLKELAHALGATCRTGRPLPDGTAEVVAPAHQQLGALVDGLRRLAAPRFRVSAADLALLLDKYTAENGSETVTVHGRHDLTSEQLDRLVDGDEVTGERTITLVLGWA